MRILVVGGGGREHALCQSLANSPSAPEVLCAPGNPGTASIAENVHLSSGSVAEIVDLASQRVVDFVVVGPEQPLVDGLADQLTAIGIPVVGPSAAAARLEGSKAFAKSFMQRHSIPTAASRTFMRAEAPAALEYVEQKGFPIVVKASGLAAGKGVIICDSLFTAQTTISDMLSGDAFGEAGAEIVLEEFLEGEEASLFVVTDGTEYLILPAAQDHKRIFEGDKGPNTGGMGAYAPASVVTDGILTEVRETIIEPTLAGMASEGTPFRGFLYVGLMLTSDGPRVIEYNVRLGDPEAQAVLPLIESDFARLCEAVASGNVGKQCLSIRDGVAACVVMTSAGYPGPYETGIEIKGVDLVSEEVSVFQAGTRCDSTGRLLTAGGRVLAVTAVAERLDLALSRVYEAVDAISFAGSHARRDIGHRELPRL
ncbi:phosphoribosylamine--glycine ligase [soil metagenome]